jgi:hypothetical protein
MHGHTTVVGHYQCCTFAVYISHSSIAALSDYSKVQCELYALTVIIEVVTVVNVVTTGIG